MPRAESVKIGYVRLRARGQASWQADLRNPATGRRQRLTIRASSVAGARRQAKALSSQIASGRFHDSSGTNGPMVGQAISAAIAASNGSPVTRRHYACFADLFLEWLGDKYPRVKTWDAMATEAVRDYQTHCQRELGLADDTVKRRMLPVKMASRYWHENDPERYQDVARAVHFHCSASNPLENERRERAKALSASDLAALLTYLHTREPVLHGPVLLQSLCGLRVLEALNLRRQSILRRAPSQSLKQNGTARRTGSAFAFCL